MKEMNDLEAQLRSWVPRRPSAKLEQRLFSRPVAAAASAELAASAPAFRLTWLVPATLGMLLMCLFLNQHNTAAIGTAHSGPMVAMILSNNNAAAYLPGSFPGAQNRLPADAYECTLRSGATSVFTAVLDSRRRQ